MKIERIGRITGRNIRDRVLAGSIFVEKGNKPIPEDAAVQQGPHGGRFYITKAGEKVYVGDGQPGAGKGAKQEQPPKKKPASSAESPQSQPGATDTMRRHTAAGVRAITRASELLATDPQKALEHADDASMRLDAARKEIAGADISDHEKEALTAAVDSLISKAEGIVAQAGGHSADDGAPADESTPEDSGQDEGQDDEGKNEDNEAGDAGDPDYSKMSLDELKEHREAHFRDAELEKLADGLMDWPETMTAAFLDPIALGEKVPDHILDFVGERAGIEDMPADSKKKREAVEEALDSDKGQGVEEGILDYLENAKHGEPVFDWFRKKIGLRQATIDKPGTEGTSMDKVREINKHIRKAKKK